MPNGGMDHCGKCCFHESGKCILRGINIEISHWTTCMNWNRKDSSPDGPVYAIVGDVKNGAIAYVRVPYFEGRRIDTEQRVVSGDSIFVFWDNAGKRYEFNTVEEYLSFYNAHASQRSESWDHLGWLGQFRARPSGTDHYRALRRQVWKSTVDIVQSGEYVSANGPSVQLDREAIEEARKRADFHPDTRELKIRAAERGQETQCYAIEADCLETSRLLQSAGYHPAVLNMANRHNPGGGVQGGSGAQEENVFRRTTAFASLFQYSDLARDYGVPVNGDFSYPIPRESGGIYTPALLAFRSSESTGYYLLDRPYAVNLITVPAINRPDTETRDGELLIANHMVEATREKIRAILRIGFFHGHDSLVLSAFGCGAFANPPGHVARLFREVLNEEEFNNAFRLIVFAIIDDHNAHRSHNPEGNLLPFQRVFN